MSEVQALIDAFSVQHPEARLSSITPTTYVVAQQSLYSLLTLAT
jgi:hypothetical protein